MEMETTSFVVDTQRVVQLVLDTGEWIVIICPDQVMTRSCSQALSCALPSGTPFSGRTARLGKGKISVACILDDVFIPPKESYSTVYLGWKPKDNPVGAAKWQSRSSKVIPL